MPWSYFLHGHQSHRPHATSELCGPSWRKEVGRLTISLSRAGRLCRICQVSRVRPLGNSITAHGDGSAALEASGHSIYPGFPALVALMVSVSAASGGCTRLASLDKPYISRFGRVESRQSSILVRRRCHKGAFRECWPRRCSCSRTQAQRPSQRHWCDRLLPCDRRAPPTSRSVRAVYPASHNASSSMMPTRS